MKKPDWRKLFKDELINRNGTMFLRFQTCTNCGTVHVPAEQCAGDVGLLAMTPCSCGTIVFSVIGETHFVLDTNDKLGHLLG